MTTSTLEDSELSLSHQKQENNFDKDCAGREEQAREQVKNMYCDESIHENHHEENDASNRHYTHFPNGVYIHGQMMDYNQYGNQASHYGFHPDPNQGYYNHPYAPSFPNSPIFNPYHYHSSVPYQSDLHQLSAQGQIPVPIHYVPTQPYATQYPYPNLPPPSHTSGHDLTAADGSEPTQSMSSLVSPYFKGRRRRRRRGRRKRKSPPAVIREHLGFHKSFDEEEAITVDFAGEFEKADHQSQSGNTQNTESVNDETTVESHDL